MVTPLNRSDKIGIAKTQVDVHTLGVSTIDELLTESGYSTVIADSDMTRAFSDPKSLTNASLIERWIRENDISVIAFSYRLQPDDAVTVFQNLMYQLHDRNLLEGQGGPIKAIKFAGLPPACDQIYRLNEARVDVFYGDESAQESLEKFGIDPSLAPESLVKQHQYDIDRMQFGRELIERGEYHDVTPVDRSRTPNFGTSNEHVIDRIIHSREANLPPLMRAHAGPYSPNREEAVQEFLQWAKTLSHSGLLDVLSIGTSQLTQERFGQSWTGLRNGGGVPINSILEYQAVWDASRPILVRSYAGTTNIPKLAKMYEETLNMAWHALSLWWFSEIDGRGPNTVLENLIEHYETLKYIASTNKPFEPNVPHHFGFRGSDDVTYVVSAVLAAKYAKDAGIKDLILQTMLNNPKQTWGVNDLAKARAALHLINEFTDDHFRVYLQARAGLDYLSHDSDKAKAQLAAVTALMDDIDPHNAYSPDIIHVVSYSEGHSLATPPVIDESIKITRHALDMYRTLRRKGNVDDMTNDIDATHRTQQLIEGAKSILYAIDESIHYPLSPEGMYKIFEMGFLPVPQLRYQREKYPAAIRWQTKTRFGRVDVYEGDSMITPKERISAIIDSNL